MYFHTGTVYTAFYLLSNDILPITKSSHPNRLTLQSFGETIKTNKCCISIHSGGNTLKNKNIYIVSRTRN